MFLYEVNVKSKNCFGDKSIDRVGIFKSKQDAEKYIQEFVKSKNYWKEDVDDDNKSVCACLQDKYTFTKMYITQRYVCDN